MRIFRLIFDIPILTSRILPVEAEESPTLVLDRADATAPSLHQPIVSPDPFRDVIKTEPAPDLPSLIEDMIPYLVEHGITTPRPSTTSTLKPLQANFDFVDKLAILRPPYRPDEDPTRLISKNKYNLNQDEHPEEAISPSYNSKETEQTANHVSETIPEKTGSPITDRATKKQEDQTVPSLLDATNSNSIKSNTSNVDTSANVSSKLDELKLNNSKLNNSRYHSATSKPSSAELEDPIFSLDSVLDLLFSSENMNNNQDDKDTKATETSTTSKSTTDVSRESEDERMSSRASEKTEEHVTEAGTSSKVLENEIPVSVASLLKLAGCNIYGRMYRVGRIITELSGPCLECRCTEIGVQCKQLKC